MIKFKLQGVFFEGGGELIKNLLERESTHY